MTRDGIPIKSFGDIAVVPYTAVINKPRSAGSLLKGGPIWPDWEGRGFERHWWDDKPIDDCPAPLPATAMLDEPNLYWGGAICQQFGHQVMDFSMRVLPSRFACPDAKLVYAMPQTGARKPPGWFFSLMDWMGVGPNDLRIISAPVDVKLLHVAAQAERLRHGGPEPAHLDRMDRFVASKGLAREKTARAIYVSRAGQRLRFGGECYLETAVAAAGGQIIRPEEHSIREQIGQYMNAGRLIFAEGSSLHLLSLAGRQFADIDVLVRGRGVELAAASTAPRCASLTYVDCIKVNLRGTWPGTSASLTKSFPVFDEFRLMDFFASRGLALAGQWDHAHYVRQVAEDFALWLSVGWRPGGDRPAQAVRLMRDAVAEQLTADAELADTLVEIIDRIAAA